MFILNLVFHKLINRSYIAVLVVTIFDNSGHLGESNCLLMLHLLLFLLSSDQFMLSVHGIIVQIFQMFVCWLDNSEFRLDLVSGVLEKLKKQLLDV